MTFCTCCLRYMSTCDLLCTLQSCAWCFFGSWYRQWSLFWLHI